MEILEIMLDWDLFLSGRCLVILENSLRFKFGIFKEMKTLSKNGKIVLTRDSKE